VSTSWHIRRPQLTSHSVRHRNTEVAAREELKNDEWLGGACTEFVSRSFFGENDRRQLRTDVQRSWQSAGKHPFLLGTTQADFRWSLTGNRVGLLSLFMDPAIVSVNDCQFTLTVHFSEQRDNDVSTAELSFVW